MGPSCSALHCGAPPSDVDYPRENEPSMNATRPKVPLGSDSSSSPPKDALTCSIRLESSTGARELLTRTTPASVAGVVVTGLSYLERQNCAGGHIRFSGIEHAATWAIGGSGGSHEHQH